jgi:hypothetical protein
VPIINDLILATEGEGEDGNGYLKLLKLILFPNSNIRSKLIPLAL